LQDFIIAFLLFLVFAVVFLDSVPGLLLFFLFLFFRLILFNGITLTVGLVLMTHLCFVVHFPTTLAAVVVCRVFVCTPHMLCAAELAHAPTFRPVHWRVSPALPWLVVAFLLLLLSGDVVLL
jgi:hypothetical protein